MTQFTELKIVLKMSHALLNPYLQWKLPELLISRNSIKPFNFLTLIYLVNSIFHNITVLNISKLEMCFQIGNIMLIKSLNNNILLQTGS